MTRSPDDPAALAGNDAGRFRLRLLVSEDGLSCVAFPTPGPPPDLPPTPQDLLDLLAAAEVTEGIDADSVASAVATPPDSFPPEGIVVARGKPAVAPHDGYVDLRVRPDTGEASYTVRPDGSIDFRDRSDYDLVSEGQELGTYHPPTTGSPGMTVTGHAIPVPPHARQQVVFGKGIRIERETNRILATVPGRVLQASNALSVEEEYVVRGDVDFRVGNVRNPGFVVVSGDVGDHFSVWGGKGIRVGGIVGAAQIRSEGDISVSGVTGKGTGKIVCGGAFRARFLNEAHVEAAGDVVVETEIRASTVHAGGSVLIPNGVVAGGEIVAGRGIEAGTAGSPMGVATALHAGTHYRNRARIEEMRAKLREAEAEIARAEASAGTEPPDEAALGRMHPTQRELVEKRFGKLTALRTAALLLRDEIARGNLEDDPESNAMINVRKTMHEGVVVNLWHAGVPIREEREGPFTIIENSLDGTLRFLPLQPLRRNAREVEAAILAAERA